MRRSAAVFILMAAPACRKTPPHVEAIADATAPGFALVRPSATANAAGSARLTTDAGSFALFELARPTSGKPIGHTSIAFKLGLSPPATCAWKPRSRRGGSRYKGEIAAYRLGIALAIPNVPPAIPRSFTTTSLRNVLTESGRTLFDAEVLPETDGSVSGALIPWIADLEFLPLESDTWQKRWKKWLSANHPEPLGDEAQLASQISMMLSFDYLQANWDRWSGGNVGFDRTSNRILFIDNDGGFLEPAPADALARQLALVHECDRYSRAFVAAVQALEPVRLSAAINLDAFPLLDERVLAGIETRRKKFLEVVRSKIAARGEANVLAFP